MGSGCWGQVVLGVVDGSGWWWLENNACLLLQMPTFDLDVARRQQHVLRSASAVI